MSTSTRMLRLLSLLQTHRYWTGPELSDRLGVSERTLRRDVDRLRRLGYDVAASRGVAGGYQLRAGKALPPLLLEDDEAVAIALGLGSAAATAVDGGGDAALRALTKVTATLPPALRGRLDALQQVTVPGPMQTAAPLDAQTLTTLAACCRDRDLATFGYTAGSGEPTERRVEPHQLVSYAGRWYLVAFDLVREDWRTFRLDRISGVAVPGSRFTPRALPGDSALELVRRGRTQRQRRYAVAVRFDLPPDRLAPMVSGWGEVEPDGEGASLWRIGVDSLEWPVMLIAQAGVDVQILEPAQLREQVREAGRRLARAGGEDPRHGRPARGGRPG